MLVTARKGVKPGCSYHDIIQSCGDVVLLPMRVAPRDCGPTAVVIEINTCGGP